MRRPATLTGGNGAMGSAEAEPVAPLPIEPGGGGVSAVPVLCGRDCPRYPTLGLPPVTASQLKQGGPVFVSRVHSWFVFIDDWGFHPLQPLRAPSSFFVALPGITLSTPQRPPSYDSGAGGKSQRRGLSLRKPRA